jgi:hypothetical protein
MNLKSLKIVKKKLLTELYIDFNSDYKKSIFIAGTGRSGTTWVSSIINYNNEYRYIFEPFYSDKVSNVKNFKYRQYLRPDDRGKEFIEPTKAILSGKVRSKWTDRFNKRFISNKRLIKDIRANLLLSWIHNNFPSVPIILLLRHPCAVVNSHLKLNWDNHLDEILAQAELIEDFLEPFKQKILLAETDFEKQIFLWCIENYVPLKQFKRGEIHLAFYENFCECPKDEIERLFSFLGKKFDETIFLNLSKPSSMSRKESAVITGDSIVDSWRKHITDEQLQKAVEIMSLFGLDRIYSEEVMPDVSSAYALMSTN